MTIKERVKELWRLCFNDSEEFVDLYFRLRYTTKDNVFMQSGEDVIAALQLIPYQMTFCGTQIATSYVSGVCTHPEHRGRGAMKELLAQAFGQMARKGTSVSTLIPAEPWLFDYYARSGFAPVFSYTEQMLVTANLQPLKNITYKYSSKFGEQTYEYFDRMMAQRTCCIQHDEKDYKVILEDLELSGGGVCTAHDNNNMVGMVMVVPQGNVLHVKELFAQNEAVKESLLREAALHNHASRISLLLPPAEGEPGKKLGMARIVYAKSVLQLYAAAHPDLELNIELTDEQIAKNNGYFYVVNGKCMTTRKRIPGVHLNLSIGELTQMVFKDVQPYMSLMLN